jgi:hypothetical protein
MLQKYTHSDLTKCSCEQTDSKRCWCGWKEVPPSTCMTCSTMAAMNQKQGTTCQRKKLPARIQLLARQFHQQLLKTNWKRRSRSAFYSVRLSAQSFLVARADWAWGPRNCESVGLICCAGGGLKSIPRTEYYPPSLGRVEEEAKASFGVCSKSVTYSAQSVKFMQNVSDGGIHRLERAFSIS